jgi:hypothetical protein
MGDSDRNWWLRTREAHRVYQQKEIQEAAW